MPRRQPNAISSSAALLGAAAVTTAVTYGLARALAPSQAPAPKKTRTPVSNVQVIRTEMQWRKAVQLDLGVGAVIITFAGAVSQLEQVIRQLDRQISETSRASWYEGFVFGYRDAEGNLNAASVDYLGGPLTMIVWEGGDLAPLLDPTLKGAEAELYAGGVMPRDDVQAALITPSNVFAPRIRRVPMASDWRQEVVPRWSSIEGRWVEPTEEQAMMDADYVRSAAASYVADATMPVAVATSQALDGSYTPADVPAVLLARLIEAYKALARQTLDAFSESIAGNVLVDVPEDERKNPCNMRGPELIAGSEHVQDSDVDYRDTSGACMYRYGARPATVMADAIWIGPECTADDTIVGRDWLRSVAIPALVDGLAARGVVAWDPEDERAALDLQLNAEAEIRDLLEAITPCVFTYPWVEFRMDPQATDEQIAPMLDAIDEEQAASPLHATVGWLLAHVVHELGGAVNSDQLSDTPL
jgi:hypothetical protein